MFYVGAGTSGRLGVLDASECPPTYRTNPGMVQGIIAGGDKALKNSIEGAEDSTEDGANSIIEKEISENDVVLGISANGNAPFIPANRFTELFYFGGYILYGIHGDGFTQSSREGYF